MIKNNFKVTFFLLFSSFIIACNSPSGDLPISGAISDANDAKKAVVSLQQYDDTANTAWKELEKADSIKIADISRLILEISYSKGMVAPKEFSDLQRLLSEVQTSRLTLADQFKNASLQKYDALTDSLTEKTLRMNAKLKLANKVKPIMVQLAESIDQDENSVIIKRVMYDDAAKKYNDYFSEKKSVIVQMDSTAASKPVRAYFNISNPI